MMKNKFIHLFIFTYFIFVLIPFTVEVKSINTFSTPTNILFKENNMNNNKMFSNTFVYNSPKTMLLNNTLDDNISSQADTVELSLQVERHGIEFFFTASLNGIDDLSGYTISWENKVNKSTPTITSLGNEWTAQTVFSKDATTTVTATVTNGVNQYVTTYEIPKIVVTLTKQERNGLMQKVDATFAADGEILNDMSDCGYEFQWSMGANYRSSTPSTNIFLYNNNVARRYTNISVYKNGVVLYNNISSDLRLDYIDARFDVIKDSAKKTLEVAVVGKDKKLIEDLMDKGLVSYQWYFVNANGGTDNTGERTSVNGSTAQTNFPDIYINNKTHNKKMLEYYQDVIIYPGQKLKLPTSVNEDDYYVVNTRDSLTSIAQNNNTTVDELKRINNLSPNIIYSVNITLNVSKDTYYNNGNVTCYVHVNLNEKNVIYVDNTLTTAEKLSNGKTYNPDQRHRGFDPEHPIRSLSFAYTLLNEISDFSDNTVDENIIVFVKNYVTNDGTVQLEKQTLLYSVPATITGSYGTVNPNGDNNPNYLFYGSRYFYADTKFSNLNFNGNKSTGNTFFVMNGYDLTIDKNISMINYAVNDVNWGGPAGTTKITIVGGQSEYTGTEIYNQKEKTGKDKSTITVRSGCFGRIIGTVRHEVYNPITNNTIGTADNPFNIEINIEYEDSERNIREGYPVDISAIIAGQADGNSFANTTINFKKGNVGLVVNGGQGAVLKTGQDPNDYNVFSGNATFNMYGGEIDTLIGATLGRNNSSSNNAQMEFNHFGDVNINIEGGTINSNVYSGGASGSIGSPEKPSTININMTGGTIKGSIYGGAYGTPNFSQFATKYMYVANVTPNHGKINGNINLNITGGTIEGNVYGGGRGTKEWEKASSNRGKSLAQIIGNVDMIIGGNAKINGNIYGAGDGFIEYPDMAKITGTVSIKIKDNPDIKGNIYGAGANSQVEGNIKTEISNIEFENNIFGGGDLGLVNGNTEIKINSGTLNSIYAGGNKAIVHNTKLIIKSGTIENAFAGGNEAKANDTEIEVSGGTINYLYGGGNLADIDKSVVTVDAGKISYLYGGGFEGKTIQNTSFTINDGEITDLYGGGNQGVVSENTNITVNNGTITNLYAGGNAATVVDTTVNIKNGTVTNLYGGGKSADIESSNITIEGGTFKNIYGGGYSGNVNGKTILDIKNSKIEEVYGGGYSGTVGEKIDKNTRDTTASSIITIESGTIDNVFGGGNRGEVYGDTSVTIGTLTTKTVVTGIVYGGGRGYDSSSHTVSGNSNVLITGTNTDVENYGSIKLGLVDGEVYVRFRDYYIDNPSSKYKRMNGIDRATTVYFDNSFVLLENYDTETKKLKGIEDITNIVLPDGSGLKISANGEIKGNFIGGGELYLDSEVCLTVNGNIENRTSLTLNPILKQITGGLEMPYMIVYGDNENEIPNTEIYATHLVSADSKYDILTQLINDKAYYYINETVIIDDSIEQEVSNISGKIYNKKIDNEKDFTILANESFTSDIDVIYSFYDNNQKNDVFDDVKYGLTLQSINKFENFPINSKIIMIKNGEFYYYSVKNENTNYISLEDFVSFDTTKNYSNSFNLHLINDPKYVITNPISNVKTYLYPDNFRFIVDFKDCDSTLSEKNYFLKMNVSEDDVNIDSSIKTNMIEIQNRNYIFDGSLSNNTLASNGTETIFGELKIAKINDNLTLNEKNLFTDFELIDSSNNKVQIPKGTKIRINNDEYNIEDNNFFKLLSGELANKEIKENIKIEIDMSNVMLDNQLKTDNYKLVMNLRTSSSNVPNSKVLSSFEFPINMINSATLKNNIGLKSATLIDENVPDKNKQIDKYQIIKYKDEEKRNIEIDYSGIPELSEGYIKMSIEKKVNEFDFDEDSNSTDNVTFSKNQIDINNLNEFKKEISVNFGKKLSEGTYRVYIRLYSKDGQLLTECFENFIVLDY